MCGVITPGQPPDSTKMTCLATSPAGMPRNEPVHSRSTMSAQTRPQSSWKPVPSVLPTSATRVSGLIFPESASSCRPFVSAGVAIGHTNISTRCAFMRPPPRKIPSKAWRALEAEAGKRFQLRREIEQLVFLAELPNQLNADRQAVVKPCGDRHRRHPRKAHRQHELDVPRPFVAQK